MKAAAFDYVRATSVAEACRLLAEHGEGARVIAGGQSLLPALNMRLSAPDLLIDLARIPALRGIEQRRDVLRIGAMMRHAELLTDPAVARHAPLLPMALAHVAHPAIRSRGTLGGNLAHADPASELPACMLVLGAMLIAASPRGERRVAAADFFTGLFETALQHDEILTAIELPLPAPDARAGFHELARRSGDYAIVGAAAQARVREGRLTDLRIGFFSVGDRPILASKAAAALIGTGGTADDLARARQALSADLSPQNDLQATAETRMHLAGVVLDRVVRQILQ